MSGFSQRQQQLIKRDERVLDAARSILLERGYYGLTMEAIADVSGCRKGTLYGRFTSKEDVVVALATRSMECRTKLIKRGATFQGRSRERLVGVGEGISLFSRLLTDDSRILHTATGVIRERASPERLFALSHQEGQQIAVVQEILRAAVSEGDLVVESDEILQELTLGTWGLVEGAFSLIEMGAPQALGTSSPVTKTFRVFNRLADAYGWRPLWSEWDYDESLARIRKGIFPVEAQQLYGEEMWYGDRG